MRFVDPPAEVRRALLLGVFARSEVWESARAREIRSRSGLAAVFLLGLAGYFRALRPSRRRHPRRRILCPARLLGRDEERDVWLRDSSARGIGLVCTGERPRIDGLWQHREPAGAGALGAGGRTCGAASSSSGMSESKPSTEPAGSLEPEWSLPRRMTAALVTAGSLALLLRSAPVAQAEPESAARIGHGVVVRAPRAANMKIGNYRAAIEAYQKAAEHRTPTIARP